MKEQYEEHGLDESYKSMYHMVCWIVKDTQELGIETITFDEFLQYALCFFSQRDEETGLNYIFELYD